MSDGRNSMRTSSPSLAKYLSAAMKRGPAPGVCVTPTRIRSDSAAHALVVPTAMQNATTAAVSQALDRLLLAVMIGFRSATWRQGGISRRPALKSRLMITEFVDSLLIVGFVFLPAIILRVVNHRPDKIVRIDHPPDLRTEGHIRQQDCLEIGILKAKGRTDRSGVGLMDRDVDQRPNLLLVENWSPDAVRPNAKPHDRAEFDVCLRQGMHDCKELRAHRRRRQPGIGSKTLFQRAGRVVPDEREVIPVA